MANNNNSLNQVLRRMGRLTERVQKNILVGAVSSAAEVLRKEAKSQAPLGETGELKKAIKKTKRRYRLGDEFIRSSVGIEYTKGLTREERNKTPWYYGYIVHFGNDTTRPNPFMMRAYETKNTAALEKMKSYLRNRIDLEIRRV